MRIKATNTPVIQVNTGQGCHLESDMIQKALVKLDPKENSLLFIENVGNLVCPAMFDLGEHRRVVIMSVTEGDDKPIKYPDAFHSSQICIINKTDLLPYVNFDVKKAKEYIYICKNPDGGISYSSKNRGSSRPAITAAALAALYNAGDYDSKHVPSMLEFTKKRLHNIGGSSGHWHYTYLYYSQVVYRQGEKEWNPFRDKLYARLVREQQSSGSWQGTVGPIYVTACNLIMLQLDKGYLPIYQR